MSKGEPNWRKYGRQNRTAMPKSLIDARSRQGQGVSDIFPSGGSSPILEEMELSEHLTDLWVMLRKIAKTVFILTVFVLIIPGVENGELTLTPYRPGVLMILTSLIDYSLEAINLGSANTEIFLGSPLTPISLYINMSLFVAVLISLPLITRELVIFIRPGLSNKEFEALKRVVGTAVVLFLVGVFISYFVILPITLKLLVFAGQEIGGSAILQLYSLSSILNILMWGTLGSGLLYTSPMVLVFMVHAGILEAEQISNRRKEIILGIFFIAAIITPDPTMISMLVLSLPLIVIIEGVIVWSRKYQLTQIINKGVYYNYG